MYVDKTGMIARYGETKLVQLTDRAFPKAGAIVDQVLDQALADAAAVIHGYARSAGYAVPFSATAPPDGVAGWQACIALYGLYQGEAPDKVAEDYKTTLGQLRDLAAGRFTLQAAGIAAPAPAEGAAVLFSASDRVMTAKGLKDF
jgi:phage gp36-like protein